MSSGIRRIVWFISRFVGILISMKINIHCRTFRRIIKLVACKKKKKENKIINGNNVKKCLIYRLQQRSWKFVSLFRLPNFVVKTTVCFFNHHAAWRETISHSYSSKNNGTHILFSYNIFYTFQNSYNLTV